MMKKFGTPSGAGPGIENEKVGLEGVGTPLLVTGGGLTFDLPFAFLELPVCLPLLFKPLWLESVRRVAREVLEGC